MSNEAGNNPAVSSRMRDDWNSRAEEDAGYYVAFGRRDQDDEEFFATGAETAASIALELKRLSPDHRGRALEIGCGPGRLMRPMSAHFAEIHGVDVSDRMIALAKEKLARTPNAFPRATDGANLPHIEDASVDFVYSYAVFQHIPSRDVVWQYMREISRVLKPMGVARLQFNGLPRTESAEAAYNTWAGSRFTREEILAFCAEHDIQVLAMEGVDTQYMWTTWRKRSPGWHEAPVSEARIRRVTNANGSEPVAPCSGRFAAISVWADGLPEAACLNYLGVTVAGVPGRLTYIGPPDASGLCQIAALLPDGASTGLAEVALTWKGKSISRSAILRVIPPPPLVPRVVAVTDGVNLVLDHRVETGSIKLVLEDIERPESLGATIDGAPVEGLEYFRTDPRPKRYEVNCRVPASVSAGGRLLTLNVGKRRLAPIPIEIVRA